MMKIFATELDRTDSTRPIYSQELTIEFENVRLNLIMTGKLNWPLQSQDAYEDHRHFDYSLKIKGATVSLIKIESDECFKRIVRVLYPCVMVRSGDPISWRLKIGYEISDNDLSRIKTILDDYCEVQRDNPLTILSHETYESRFA